jgi:5-methylcytosine-specific restriction endonuclease McrA
MVIRLCHCGRPKPCAAHPPKPKPAMAERRKAFWLRARAATLQRDGHTCQRCGATMRTARLHVHHVVPRSQGGITALENLLTLCERCHPIVEHERPVFFDREAR